MDYALIAYLLLAFGMVMYVVLDGFDLGLGILLPFAKDADERERMLASVTTAPAGVHVQIRFKGEVIADTRDAVRLEETHVGHVVAPIVYYIPRKDVRMERLVRIGHSLESGISAKRCLLFGQGDEGRRGAI